MHLHSTEQPITDQAQVPGLDRTHDLHLASYLIGKRLARLKGISGRSGERVFEFDAPVTPEVLLDFHGSDEKRVLDCYKSLKASMFSR
jgi:hypothetical protein